MRISDWSSDVCSSDLRIVEADTNYSVPRNTSYIHVHADDLIGLRDAFGSLHKLGQVLLKQIRDAIPIKGLSRDEYDLLLYGELSDDEFVCQRTNTDPHHSPKYIHSLTITGNKETHDAPMPHTNLYPSPLVS